MLKPRCMIAENSESVMGIAYTSDGFLLPCCWLDGHGSKEKLTNLGLYNEELKLKNNDSVESIITSNQWKNFIKILIETPEIAPEKCHEKCRRP